MFLTGGIYWPSTTGLLVTWTRKSRTLSLYFSAIFSLLPKDISSTFTFLSMLDGVKRANPLELPIQKFFLFFVNEPVVHIRTSCLFNFIIEYWSQYHLFNYDINIITLRSCLSRNNLPGLPNLYLDCGKITENTLEVGLHLLWTTLWQAPPASNTKILIHKMIWNKR